MKIKISSGNYEGEFDEADSWNETIGRAMGMLMAVTVARDHNRITDGVKKIKND